MIQPLPARPQGIRTSPDGLSVAVLYDSEEYGRRWVTMTCRDDGTIHQLQLLAPVDVRGWDEWTPPPMEMPPRTDVRAKTVQEVVDGLPPGTEVT